MSSTYNQYTSTLRQRLDDDELDEWELEVYFEAYYPVQEGLHSVQHMVRLARMGAEDGAQSSDLAWIKEKSKLWKGQPWRRR